MAGNGVICRSRLVYLDILSIVASIRRRIINIAYIAVQVSYSGGFYKGMERLGAFISFFISSANWPRKRISMGIFVYSATSWSQSERAYIWASR
jgi:hypothetical protein